MHTYFFKEGTLNNKDGVLYKKYMTGHGQGTDMTLREKLKAMGPEEIKRINDMAMNLPKRELTPDEFRAQMISNAMSFLENPDENSRARMEAEFKKQFG